jgi:DNA-binding GntR family transcriptional regulator
MARRDGSAADGASGVVHEIRAAIIRGELSPNERLVELELAQRYSTSRGAVRVALLELVNEGLVDREPHRGARVRAVSQDEAIEIAEVRTVIEGLCARKAAERILPQEADELRQLVASMEDTAAVGDLMAYSALNGRLHGRIAVISRHGVAGRIVERMRNQSVSRQFRLSLVPGRASVSVAEHAAVVEAVASRDPDRAEQAMREHLSSVALALAELGPALQRSW